MTQSCVILGSGGHAKVVIDCIQASRSARIAGILDAEPSRSGQKVQGIPILGADDMLPTMRLRGICFFAVGVGCTGDTSLRRSLFELGMKSELKPLKVVHPSALCSDWAIVGPGGQLFPGSIVNAGAEIGCNVIVNSGVVVEHDCVIGDHVSIGTGARLAGGVRVAEGAHIGIGATVRQCIEIGERAVVGAGAVVVRDVPPSEVVAGVPARPLQEVAQ